MNKYDIIITDVYYINNGREAEVLPGEILLVELGADKDLQTKSQLVFSIQKIRK